MENNLRFLVNALNERLKQPLPGAEAQYKMAPDLRISRDELFSTYKNPKQSAVLILLHEYNDGIALVLIERTAYSGIHSKQIAFPGGKVDGDETFEQTAIRETAEELGIDPGSINIIGQLTDLIIPTSNFRVVPLVGFLNKHQQFIPDKREVESVMNLPLIELLNADLVLKKEFGTDNRKVVSKYYCFGNYHVWGATAMILSEFGEIIKETLK